MLRKLFFILAMSFIPAAPLFASAFAEATSSIDWTTFSVSGDIQVTDSDTHYGDYSALPPATVVSGWPDVFVGYPSQDGTASALGATDKVVEAHTSNISKGYLLDSGATLARLSYFTARSDGYVQVTFDYLLSIALSKDDSSELSSAAAWIDFDIVNDVHYDVVSPHPDLFFDSLSGSLLAVPVSLSKSGTATAKLYFHAGDSGWLATGPSVLAFTEGSFLPGDPNPSLRNFPGAFATNIPEPSAFAMLCLAALALAAVKGIRRLGSL